MHPAISQANAPKLFHVSPLAWQARYRALKAAAQEAIKFFKWAFEKGDKMAEELDYIPMPDPVVKLIEKTWSAEIKS